MSKAMVVEHPLVQHKVSLLRSKNTGTKEFKELVSELAMLLCYEATRDLSLIHIWHSLEAGGYLHQLQQLERLLLAICRRPVDRVRSYGARASPLFPLALSLHPQQRYLRLVR